MINDECGLQDAERFQNLSCSAFIFDHFFSLAHRPAADNLSEMNRLFFRFSVWILLSLCLFGAQPSFGDLAGTIDGILRDPPLAKVLAGIEIIHLGSSVESSRIIYRHNSDVPLTPASNLKMITSSAALDRLGPDFNFRTQLVSHDGDLILVGDGDPAFGDAELLSRFGWDVDTVFKQWAEQLKSQKIGPVRNVLVDDSIFDTDFFNPGWPAEQRLNRYEAEVAGMNLNANCLDFYLHPNRPGELVTARTNPVARFYNIRNECLSGEGKPSIMRAPQSDDMIIRGRAPAVNDVPLPVTIHDAPLFAANVFAETLVNIGLVRSGDVHRDRTIRDAMNRAQSAGDKSWQLLAIHETPLAQVLGRANKDSMNLYGECLCKRLGAEITRQSGSWQNGTAAVGQFLKKLGVPESQFHLSDGCGLSKENQITASAITRVLLYDYFSHNSKTLIDSLAIAGVDGTLTDRFHGSSLRGRVIGKTGTVDGVSCLSGYLHARDGQWYVFSILMNKSFAGLGKPTQEKIVNAIDESVPTVRN
jgi:D-alanyl-D-alanine carboxypeptidase/D-alanyl-D-alanine-endopeptidase (penicillin-binding protein 4)